MYAGTDALGTGRRHDAQYEGSWNFVFVFIVVMSLWSIANSVFYVFGKRDKHGFDPYPTACNGGVTVPVGEEPRGAGVGTVSPGWDRSGSCGSRVRSRRSGSAQTRGRSRDTLSSLIRERGRSWV